MTRDRPNRSALIAQAKLIGMVPIVDRYRLSIKTFQCHGWVWLSEFRGLETREHTGEAHRVEFYAHVHDTRCFVGMAAQMMSEDCVPKREEQNDYR